ncbi:MAG: hypothetical protein LKM35_05975 [Lachnospiraceae bacterium]|jgi:hypothetical protein|nr:hypothetical protein [Lachnospiraceae bacterium]
MKRKIWSVILTVCMVLGMMPAMSVHVAASAMIYYTVGETKIGNDAGPIASATGDGWTWTYCDGAGTLTLTDAYIRGADSRRRQLRRVPARQYHDRAQRRQHHCKRTASRDIA